MKKQGTFVVNIMEQENATWQGRVTWLDQKETRCFRSMLELIRLLDTAVGGQEENIVEICGYVPLAAHPGQLTG
ncbi:MAG: hypothetical protein HFG22_06150 [Lachnospiraceae bacterium]|nr:hypothetical protein [Lachnospiraceae bacterium]